MFYLLDDAFRVGEYIQAGGPTLCLEGLARAPSAVVLPKLHSSAELFRLIVAGRQATQGRRPIGLDHSRW